MDRIHLSVVPAEGPAIDRAVSYVNIPTPAGSIGVLAGHVPMLCAVKKGVLRYSFGEGNITEKLLVGDGVANVNRTDVTLLVSSVSVSEEQEE